MIIIIISGVTIVIFDMCHLQSHHDCRALVTYYFWWSSMHLRSTNDFSFSNLCHIPAQFPRWEESRHPEQPKLNCLEPAARSPVAQLAYLEGTRRAFTWLSSYLTLRVNQGLDIYWINLVSFCDIVEIFIVIEIATTKCAPLSSNHRLSRVLAIKLVLATEPLFNRSLFQKINIGVHAIKAISLH